MSWKDFLDSLGIVPGQAVAGFAGGLVNVFLFRSLAAIDVVGAVVIGTFTSLYLGKFLAETIHLPVEVVCFGLGVGGAPLLGQLISWGRQQLPKFPGGGDANP